MERMFPDHSDKFATGANQNAVLASLKSPNSSKVVPKNTPVMPTMVKPYNCTAEPLGFIFSGDKIIVKYSTFDNPNFIQNLLSCSKGMTTLLVRFPLDEKKKKSKESHGQDVNNFLSKLNHNFSQVQLVTLDVRGVKSFFDAFYTFTPQRAPNAVGGKGKKRVSKTPKIHTGPNGGKYYIKSGKKVYVK
jgi:hypothetical protein